MPQSARVGDLAAAVSDALRGDGAALPDVVAGARQRTQDRALDALRLRVEAQSAPLPLASARPRQLPQPWPDRETVIRLPNGRRLRATISPAVARRRDLSAVARASAENDRRAFAAIGRQHNAIQRLARSQEELAGKVAAVQARTDQAVIGLVQGFAGLERRVRTTGMPLIATRSSGESPGAGRSPAGKVRPGGRAPRLQRLREAAKMQRAADVRLLATRAQIQNITNVVNSLQSTAYGEKGRLLATNNLLLAGSQLFWSFLDPVLQKAGVLNAASATVVASLAPLGSLLTGQILLAERQMPRFISGIATFEGFNTRVVQSLRDQIGESRWPDFVRRTDVPVSLTMLDDAPRGVEMFLRADVVAGDVRISLPDGIEGPVPRFRVAWTVDTGADRG